MRSCMHPAWGPSAPQAKQTRSISTLRLKCALTQFLTDGPAPRNSLSLSSSPISCRTSPHGFVQSPPASATLYFVVCLFVVCLSLPQPAPSVPGIPPTRIPARRHLAVLISCKAASWAWGTLCCDVLCHLLRSCALFRSPTTTPIVPLLFLPLNTHARTHAHALIARTHSARKGMLCKEC